MPTQNCLNQFCLQVTASAVIEVNSINANPEGFTQQVENLHSTILSGSIFMAYLDIVSLHLHDCTVYKWFVQLNCYLNLSPPLCGVYGSPLEGGEHPRVMRRV